MSYEFIKEIVKEIITDSFTYPLPITFQNNKYINIDFNSIHLLQYKTLLQGGNNLCGFYSLFNLIHFIEYIKNNNATHYLNAMNSRWEFWKFHKETINRIIDKIELSAQKNLLANGPLERYQFNYLIKHSLIFDSTNDIDFTLITFFYGFGLFHCTNKNDVKNNQCAINEFVSNNDTNTNKDKDKKRFLIVLLGIVNHWNILIIEKKDKEYAYSFLDSRNIDVLSIKEDQIEAFSQNMIDYLNKFNRVPSQWWMKCFGQWIKDMHKAMTIIIDLIQAKLSLFDLYFNDTLNRLIDSFETYTHISLDGMLNVDESIKDKSTLLLKWMKEEYHPTIAIDELIEGIEIFNYIDKLKTMTLYPKFLNWVSIIEKTAIDLSNSNNNINSEINNEMELILRYKEVISTLKRLLNL